MSAENVTTLLVALITGVLGATVTAVFSRPKTKAEANAADANASVALSSEAREWAQMFHARAAEADKRAVDAEARADAADAKAAAADQRAEEADEKARLALERAAAAESKTVELEDRLEALEHVVPTPRKRRPQTRAQSDPQD